MEAEREHLSVLLHEKNESLSGREQERLSEQQAHLEQLKGAEEEAAQLRRRIEELSAELSASWDKCEVSECYTWGNLPLQCRVSVHLAHVLVDLL